MNKYKKIAAAVVSTVMAGVYKVIKVCTRLRTVPYVFPSNVEVLTHLRPSGFYVSVIISLLTPSFTFRFFRTE